MNSTLENFIPVFIWAVFIWFISTTILRAWKLWKILSRGVNVTGQILEIDTSGEYYHEYTYEFKISTSDRIWKKVAEIPSNLRLDSNSKISKSIEITYEKNNPDNSHPTALLKKSFNSQLGVLSLIAIFAIYILWATA